MTMWTSNVSRKDRNILRGQPKHDTRSVIKSASKASKARKQRQKLKRHHKRNRQCKYRSKR